MSLATDSIYLIDLKSSDEADNGEYAIYGMNKEYMALELKKHRAEIERLAARLTYSVLREKITNSVIFV